MRIGVFGGTFDPPHVGHLRAAIAARDALALDRVLLVVANVPWQKVGDRAITPAPVRLELVRAAVEGLDGLEACPVEIDRGGNSYTVDTLRDLGVRHPGARLVVLVGADVVGSLDTWHDATALPELAELAVFDRPARLDRDDRLDRGDRSDGDAVIDPAPPVAPGVSWPAVRVPVGPIGVSSSEIRERVRDGRAIDLLVPTPVASMIGSLGLYRDGP